MVRLDDPDELLLHSSGAPVCDDDEIKVVDDDGNEVPDGAPGELVTRGPYTIRGYYNAPEKNREAFTADGFYRMGDIVRKRGRHVFTEGPQEGPDQPRRREDQLRGGGEPDLRAPEGEGRDAGGDARSGVRREGLRLRHPEGGRDADFDELIAFLQQQNIASFKLPERLELVSEFPLSPVGKILKRQLREAIAEKMAREKGAGAAGRTMPGGERMKIGIIGGGPAGLFFAYLMKRARPGPRHRVAERDPARRHLGLRRGVLRHRARVRPRRRRRSSTRR